MSAPAPTLAADTILRAITIEDVVARRARSMSGLRWAGNATLIAERADESGSPKLVIWRLAGGDQDTMAAGKHASVSPDGRWIVFQSDNQWRLRSLVDGRERDLSFDRPVASVYVPQNPRWSSDSRRIAILESESFIKPGTPTGNTRPIEAEGHVNVIDVGALADTRAAVWGVGKSFITLVEIDEKQKARTIEVPDAVYRAAWGDNDSLFFVRLHYAKPIFTSIVRIDARSRSMSEIYRLDGGLMQGAGLSVSPDGTTLAVTLDIDNKHWDDFRSLIVLNARGGLLRRLTQALHVYEPIWARDGRSLYFIARHGGLPQIFKCDLSGNTVRVSRDQRRYFDLQMSPDGSSLSYQTHDGHGRRDIRVLSLATDEERVVAVLDDPLQQFALGKFEQVKFPSADGLELFGFLIYPPDFEPVRRRYPLYVDVHGGGRAAPLTIEAPITGAVVNGPLEWHAWAAQGYVVFVPDFRSSGEYGPAIAQQLEAAGDFLGIEHDVRDIEAGINWVLARDFIDAERIGVFGHSAGGARVNYLLTRSHRFRAAAIHEPSASGQLALLLGLTTDRYAGSRFEDAGFWGLAGAGRFADTPSAYTRGFLFDGHKSTTPTLILVGGNRDKSALPPVSAEVLFSMLRQYDVPTRMLRYPDDGHNPSTAVGALHRFKQVQAWFAQHLDMSVGTDGQIVFKGGRPARASH